MVKDNESFFATKQIWSEVKDELLGCYLKPYVTKILRTGHPLFYVDCFAGKGKFEDGKDGSPLIALKIIEECLENQNERAETCFIDKKYARTLADNLKAYSRATIVSGTYENNIKSVLGTRQNDNVFLYIDPYGVKALHYDLFNFLTEQRFNSIELLLNLNSFGFIREACRALGAEFSIAEPLDDLVEFELPDTEPFQKSISDLTQVAGGDYWQSIIHDYKSHRTDTYEAEKRFVDEYCSRLKIDFRYVLNMPIRLKRGQRPKYRMIHVTNHEDGCVLMYENMSKRWQLLEGIQSQGQMSIFNQNAENEIVDLDEMTSTFSQHLLRYRADTPLNRVKADFLTDYGVVCQPKDLNSIIRRLEDSGVAQITRRPSTTSNNKPAKNLTVSTGKKIWIRSNK